jgi:hypothetical protein
MPCAAPPPAAMLTFAVFPRSCPARRILERLRRSFLEHAEAPDVRNEAPDVVAIIRAIERVQEALDLDAAHRFAARLTGRTRNNLLWRWRTTCARHSAPS